MTIDFEIILGTYEQFLLGYKVQNVDNRYHLERSFATHSHLASVRAVASNRHYLASAGADDSVFLYDMRYRIESGRLMHHNDTINCIDFTPDASHVVTASSDGSIGIIRCGSWLLEKHWKSPHKGNSVNALAIHPTGKLAMSAGGDGVLRTWNLVKGRLAYATNLVPRLKSEAKNITMIRWNPEGDKYLLVAHSKIDVYSVETAGLCSEMSFDSRIASVEFLENDLLAIGHEDGKIRFYDIKAGSSTLETEAHDARVKCLAHRDNYLVSASSLGEIKLWRYGKKKLNVLSRASCGARITCMTLTQPCPDLTVKKEEPKVEEVVDKSRESVFRLRQEVIIEDEGDEKLKAKNRKARKKKSGKKREAEVTVDESEEKSIKRVKKKKNKNASIEIASNDSKGKRKRSFSVEKATDNTIQESKGEPTKKKLKKAIVKIENSVLNDSNISSMENTKNKKKKITPIEKPSKPVSKKRKQQSVISNASTGFPSKTKKKKIAR